MKYKIPILIRIFRPFLAFFFRLLFRFLSRVRINGNENIPSSGGYIIAINHVSLFDPPFVIAFWPRIPEGIGAAEIWKKSGQSVLARLYGGIPVHRGQYDRRPLKLVIAALRSGRPVVIAPEGTRSHHPGMQQGMPGVAFVLDQCDVPVVPVGIVGTTEDFFSKGIHGNRPVIEMRIGKPLQPAQLVEKGDDRRLVRQLKVDRIMYAIAELLPEEYRGFYSKKAGNLEVSGAD